MGFNVALPQGCCGEVSPCMTRLCVYCTLLISYEEHCVDLSRQRKGFVVLTHTLFTVLLCVCMCMHACFMGTSIGQGMYGGQGASSLLLYHSAPYF